MHAQYLELVKTLIQIAPEFDECNVKVYIEPSISSTVFYINADGYNHIFKAPFGLLESKLTASTLVGLPFRKTSTDAYPPPLGTRIAPVQTTIKRGTISPSPHGVKTI